MWAMWAMDSNRYQNDDRHGVSMAWNTYQNHNVGNVGNVVMRFQSLAKRRGSSYNVTYSITHINFSR
jgi:hypothetical protein